jgi:hypothetical protein
MHRHYYVWRYRHLDAASTEQFSTRSRINAVSNQYHTDCLAQHQVMRDITSPEAAAASGSSVAQHWRISIVDSMPFHYR